MCLFPSTYQSNSDFVGCFGEMILWETWKWLTLWIDTEHLNASFVLGSVKLDCNDNISISLLDKNASEIPHYTRDIGRKCCHILSKEHRYLLTDGYFFVSQHVWSSPHLSHLALKKSGSDKKLYHFVWICSFQSGDKQDIFAALSGWLIITLVLFFP